MRIFLLILLFSFWSCEKGNDEDIVIVSDPPQVSAEAKNETIPFNTSGLIFYNVEGEFDSIVINDQRVYIPRGSYSTEKLTHDSEVEVSAYYDSGKKAAVKVFIIVAEPEPTFEVTITSRSIEWGGTVGFTWKYSYFTKCTLNGVQISSPGSRNIVLTNDSTFVFVGITINGDTIRQTYVVEVGEKPTWRTFLEIGLDVTWKEYQVYYIPEGSTEWKLLYTTSDNYQVIFHTNGTRSASWDGGYGEGIWTLSGNILNFQGNAQIQSISETELVLYYEERIMGSNGQAIYVPQKFIYKKL